MIDRPEQSFEHEKQERIDKIKKSLEKLDTFMDSVPSTHKDQWHPRGKELLPLLKSIRYRLELSIRRIEVETETQRYIHHDPEEAEGMVNHFIGLYKLFEGKEGSI